MSSLSPITGHTEHNKTLTTNLNISDSLSTVDQMTENTDNVLKTNYLNIISLKQSKEEPLVCTDNINKCISTTRVCECVETIQDNNSLGMHHNSSSPEPMSGVSFPLLDHRPTVAAATTNLNELGEVKCSEVPVKDCAVNDHIKPVELTNQLVEGPRITIPPSQLPVKTTDSVSENTTCDVDHVDSSVHEPKMDVSSAPDADSVTASDRANSNCNTNMQDLSLEPGERTSSAVLEPSERTSSAVLEPGEHISSAVLEPGERTSSAVLEPGERTSSAGKQQAADPAGENKAKPKKTPKDFIFGKIIGEGSYSTVYLAKEVTTNREYAIKICDKKYLIRERKTHFVMREKEVLMRLSHPFFIALAYTFQDPERLYYVLTYACNGDLLGYLHKLSAFDVPCTRFYTAEVVIALEYLQTLGIIHRDLKPENILLGEDMHIKITDFGTAKILSIDDGAEKKEQRRKHSFVGTAEYVSPEVLNNLPANYGSDLWALGCIIYQCLSGSLPFRSGNEYQTFQKIIKVEYDFPEGFNSEARDVVEKLLVLEPEERIGMASTGGMQAIKSHPFYAGIDWDNLPQSTPPKLMPYLPATANNPEFWGQELRAGFDDQRLAEIITDEIGDRSMSPEIEELPIKVISAAEDYERKEMLRKQSKENQFHQFVEDNLIIKQGFVNKRKGLFSRKRMLLLTEGPHLYYVDAHNKVLKGEIPWSKYLRPEAKNFKIFFVHTPNRTYYLESRNSEALQWVEKIREVWTKYYGDEKD